MPLLLETIRAQQAQGVDKTTIIRTLLASGHSVTDINAAFNVLDGGAPSLAGAGLPPTPVPPSLAAPVSVPQSAPLPSPPLSTPSVPTSYRPPGLHRSAVTFGVLALLIGIVAGTAYAYVEGIGPFLNAPYTEDNFLTGLLRSSADIRSATYELAFSLSVGERDEGAVPFVATPDPDAAANAAAYARDVERMREASLLLSNLRITKPYPASLAALKPKYGTLDIKDPSGPVYGYKVTGGGTDFALTVTFETTAAIQAVARSTQSASSPTLIQGQTATFSETSRTVYLSSTSPKPFFEQLAETVRYLPTEMSVGASVGGTSNVTAQHADWKFNIAGTGDFGDLSYAFDADLLKKGSLYYFRINKMPSLFFGSFNLAKGKWVVVDPTASSTGSMGSLFSLETELPEQEESYKEVRTQATALLLEAAHIADTEQLITFKDAPSSETIDGRRLYRYNLRFSKDALAPFTKQIIAEVGSGRYPALASYTASPDLSTTKLTGPAFDDSFAYYDENTSLTIWVDRRGHPAIITYTMRIVPPDEATQLADKQITLTSTLSLEDINVPVTITAPEGAVPLESLLPERE